MNIIKYCLVAFVCLGVVADATTLQEIQQTLTRFDKTLANFTQERHIKGMPKPLKSSGVVEISLQDGLFWQQKVPFEMTMRLTETMISQQIKGGKEEKLIASENPQMFQFNKLLLSLFNLDEALLNEHFGVKLTTEGRHWQIVLSPKQAPMNKIFHTIVLKGSNYLDDVELNDFQGDRTLIHFSQQKHGSL